jgi:hypothetical protein
MSGELVLVTGGSGFVVSHCILHLLTAGYRVRTTVRSLKREADVRAMLKAGGAEPVWALSFASADLMSDAGWPEASAPLVLLELWIGVSFRLGGGRSSLNILDPDILTLSNTITPHCVPGSNYFVFFDGSFL